MTPITHTGLEVLTTAEMAKADQIAVNSGVPFLTLMENAGRAVADEAMKMVPLGATIAVLCGPGNNGGDGFVAARLLRERGHQVNAASLVPVTSLKGDAAEMARRCDTIILEDWPEVFRVENALVIDALFGAGLSRPAEGDYASAIELINQCRDNDGIPVLAVDVPSGLDGNTGRALGSYVVQATRTVTFFRKKPGHVLLPGRDLCGTLIVADIGTPNDIFDDMYFGDESAILSPRVTANAPALWHATFPRLTNAAHKYTRGHAVVVSGPAAKTGAARLGARGALRAGAGLVTVASPKDAVAVNAAHLTAIMLEPFEVPSLHATLSDTRRNAILIGPGCGVGQATRDMVETILSADRATVLDADALTSFEYQPAVFDMQPVVGERPADPYPNDTHPGALFDMIAGKVLRPHATKPTPERRRSVVLTPHEGEFKRLFGALPGSKLDRARAAARRSGAVVILKGPDTVIADPNGSAAINDNAPPWLATAGSGDVLAGFVTGLLAQGMAPFEAACAAVWLHGECANVFGPGLIAEDLPEMLPRVLAKLLADHRVQ